MTRITAIVAMLALLTAPVPLFAQTNVDGEWLVFLTLPLGEMMFNMNIVQKGENLTGYMLNDSGQFDLKGVINRDQVNIEWEFPDGGHLVAVHFAGKVDRNLIKGMAKVGDVGEGSMSAQRR